MHTPSLPGAKVHCCPVRVHFGGPLSLAAGSPPEQPQSPKTITAVASHLPPSGQPGFTPAMPRILLIDDEPAITESLAYALGRAGFETEAAASLEAGRRSLSAGDFDLMVLDLMLPDGNGLDWLRALRQRSNLPVIILSSHDDPVEHVVGLELGADDYIDKPFSPREVVARIRAVLRRTAAQGPETRTPEGFTVDEAKRLITANGQRLTLSKTEFDLLATFIASPGRVFERDQLLRRAWGSDVTVTERTVDVYIKALRKKLVQAGMEGNTIETVRGVGYRLAEPEQR